MKEKEMIKRRIPIIFVAVLNLALTGALWSQVTGAITQESERQSKPLLWILYELGKDYDCFVTIEEGWLEGEAGNKLESADTRRTLKDVGLIQELEQLRRIVPNFGYQFDPVNPRIVHVIDERLRSLPGYGLERTIARLDYGGTAYHLPTAIGKQGIPIASPSGMSTHEQADYNTVVHVNGSGLTVRGALSNFIDLNGRSLRVLWIARTKLEPRAISNVYYPWAGAPKQ